MTAPIPHDVIERAAQIGYETRIRKQFGCEAGQSFHARLGQRTIAWADLPTTIKEQEREIASAALEASGLAAEVERLTRERDAWTETAAQHCRNEEFYRGIVSQVGETFGEAARTSDDGSIQQDVLALKVPELVRAAESRIAELEREASGMAEVGQWQPTHRHYKGGLYRMISEGRHSETGEAVTIYENEARELWVRPTAMFNESVPSETYCGYAPRFARIAELSATPTTQEEGK